MTAKPETPLIPCSASLRLVSADSIRVCGFALLLSIAWLPAGPQTAASPAIRAAGSGQGLYRIAGTMVNALTGEPVRRATVAVLAEEDSHTVESTESDTNGRFELARLPAAKYQLTASKRGFRTAFFDEHDEFNSAIVTGPGQETERLVFRLTPSSALRGWVTADGGDPVEGAKVMLFVIPPDRGPDSQRGRGAGERIAQADSATTDDTGAYEFSDLATGRYLLAVSAEPWYALHQTRNGSAAKPGAEASAVLDVAYPPTYYDSTTEEASATPIVLGAGSREEANIILHPLPALHLVVTAPRKPDGSIARPELRQQIFGAQVSAESAGFQDATKSGTVEFSGVAPGHYELTQGDPPRVVDLDAASSQQIDPSDGAPSVSVSGALDSVSRGTIPDEVTVTLYSLDVARRQEQLTTVARKGHFRFEAVLPGKWELQAVGPAGQLPIVSIAANGVSRAGNTLTVGDRAQTVAVAISQGETRVEGFARKDGKGAAGVMVVLVPKNAAAFQGLVRRDQSDSDGSFALRDVAPGHYTVVAIEDGWELDRTRPEALSRFLARGITVTVTETSGKTLEVSTPVPVQSR